jgi:hypothetical protein
MISKWKFKLGDRYLATLAQQTGGKAGKGFNKTSSIQVYDMNLPRIVKQFRFKVNDSDSFHKASEKAMKLVQELYQAENKSK